jgi:hypothetical protein
MKYNAAMPEESTQWQTKETRQGVFDGYSIMGIKYENPGSFAVGWHMTVWRVEPMDPIHGYWVERGNFHSATMHLFYNYTPTNFIQIYHPPITEHLELAERKAVLKAIEEWKLPLLVGDRE